MKMSSTLQFGLDHSEAEKEVLLCCSFSLRLNIKA